ncbi:MAG TPA: hypothetical protein VN922_11705, partial [Bacteroidia bacterium]|nr:hypothetical protein [Bacteroidia bacterium]
MNGKGKDTSDTMTTVPEEFKKNKDISIENTHDFEENGYPVEGGPLSWFMNGYDSGTISEIAIRQTQSSVLDSPTTVNSSKNISLPRSRLARSGVVMISYNTRGNSRQHTCHLLLSACIFLVKNNIAPVGAKS